MCTCDIDKEIQCGIDGNDILFLIKFGKRDHLQEICDGFIRFSPSQQYVDQEIKTHDKGQGDMLEGKMKLQVSSAKMYHPETNELLVGITKPTVFTISIQDVNNMPIVCFFSGTNKDCMVDACTGRNKIFLKEEIIETIKNDFHYPDSALIIFEPSKFISNVNKALNTTSNNVRYYDYSIQTLQQYQFLCSGSETGTVGTMTYENRYRHLLCKDIAFANQQEYRFIKLDELIGEAKKYPIKFDISYLMVSTDELFSGNVLI